jgi:hypothetical protein
MIVDSITVKILAIKLKTNQYHTTQDKQLKFTRRCHQTDSLSRVFAGIL